MRKILAQIKSWLQDKFKKGFDIVKANSHTAVKVTEALKNVIGSPITDLLTALIPGELDNELKFRLRKILPEVAAKVAIGHNIIQASDDPTTALAAIKAYIESLGVEARKDWWVLFSAKVMEAISDGEVTYAEIVMLTQDAFIELYQKKP
jgi:ribosome-associated translation inhibitor RaiA